MSVENNGTSSRSAKESIEFVQSKMSDLGVIRTCRNCEHCDLEKSICTKYNAQPPISVVTTGCVSWMLFIPF